MEDDVQQMLIYQLNNRARNYYCTINNVMLQLTAGANTNATDSVSATNEKYCRLPEKKQETDPENPG